MRLEFFLIQRRANLFEEHARARLVHFVHGRDLAAPDIELRPTHHALEFVDLLSAHKGERLALAARSSRAPDAMRVVFRVIGQVKVEHHLKVIDVEPARRHIGRHKKLEASPAKFVHHAVTLRLGNIPVQPVRHIAPRVQVLIQVVDHDLGAAKNNAVAEIIHVDQPRERLDLRTPVHFEIRLLDLRRVLRDRVDLDPRRIFRISADQILNRPGNRRREKQ